MLREFASKRHVKLSRVTIRAKDDDDEATEAKPPAKHRRRRRASSDSRGAGERKESDRSLAKVRTRPPSTILRFQKISNWAL